jgi:hypothetical protein
MVTQSKISGHECHVNNTAHMGFYSCGSQICPFTLIYIYIYSPQNKNVHISILIKRKDVRGEWEELQTDTSQITEKLAILNFTHKNNYKEAHALGLACHLKAILATLNPFRTKKNCCQKLKQMKSALPSHFPLSCDLVSIRCKIRIFFLLNCFVLYVLWMITDKHFTIDLHVLSFPFLTSTLENSGGNLRYMVNNSVTQLSQCK